jgi:flagellar motor switch protein FliG
MDYRSFAKRLLQEQPQTIAVALARLQPEHSSQIIKLLPAYIQADLMTRIVRVDQLPEEVLEEIDSLLDSLLNQRRT